MKILRTILACLFAILCCEETCCSGAVRVQVRDWFGLEAELPTIRAAAERNGVIFDGDNFFILLAIRKAENGRAGREFGVMAPAALDTNLNTQAGWAAATIRKNRHRFDQGQMVRPAAGGVEQRNADASGGQDSFINFLADRYCPISVDPAGNRNLKRNVKFWFKRFKV